MITKAEYQAHANALDYLGALYESQMLQQLEDVRRLDTSRKIAQGIAQQYHYDYRKLLNEALTKGGLTAVDHYNGSLDAQLTKAQRNQIVSKAIQKQYQEMYYGATLERRLTGSHAMNLNRIKRSSVVGKELETRKRNLARIFLHTYPFGSQIALDKRILLSEMVRLEHNVAIAVAKTKEIKLAKWTLSHAHSKQDICDSLAAAYNKAVANYIRNNRLRIDPKGVYFVDQIPAPPHPNCQCYLLFFNERDFSSSRTQRAYDVLKELLGRLGGKRRKLTPKV